jgi:hypothetical protein
MATELSEVAGRLEADPGARAPERDIPGPVLDRYPVAHFPSELRLRLKAIASNEGIPLYELVTREMWAKVKE